MNFSASILPGIQFILLNSKEVDHTLCLSLTYKTLISQTDFEAVVARVTMKWSYILSGMN